MTIVPDRGLSELFVSLSAVRDPARVAAVAIAIGGVVAIGGAWFAQYGLGLAPCSLCYAQRPPYYAAVPLGLLLAVTAARFPAWAGRAGCVALGLLMVWGGSIVAYHAGAEWHWWAGPDVCADGAAAPLTSATELLARLQANPLVPCDVPAMVILGLPMAGWNVLLSGGLALVALIGAVAPNRANGALDDPSPRRDYDEASARRMIILSTPQKARLSIGHD